MITRIKFNRKTLRRFVCVRYQSLICSTIMYFVLYIINMLSKLVEQLIRDPGLYLVGTAHVGL